MNIHTNLLISIHLHSKKKIFEWKLEVFPCWTEYNAYLPSTGIQEIK